VPKQGLNEQQAFGLAVRALRTKAGLSQEALAGAARVHRTYIGSIERGERNVSLKNIWALATALNCTASELLRMAEKIGSSSG
jgi:transcriptional regulator with XRE-family HTH domain